MDEVSDFEKNRQSASVYLEADKESLHKRRGERFIG